MSTQLPLPVYFMLVIIRQLLEVHEVYSVYADKILDLSKRKAFADNQGKVAQVIRFVFVRAENIAEKRRM